MSYGIEIYFKQLKKGESPLNFAIQVKDSVMLNHEHVINSNKGHVPSHNGLFWEDDGDKFHANETDEFWLYQLFSFSFMYWKKYNLIGMIGFDMDKQTEGLFNQSVYFQDSTDQDYELSEWGDKIDIFNKIIARNQKQLEKRKTRTKDVLYNFRSRIYKEIYKTLGLDSEHSANYQSFVLSGIESNSQYMDLKWKLRLLKGEWIEEDKKKLEEFNR